jgi:hypothetical protein
MIARTQGITIVLWRGNFNSAGNASFGGRSKSHSAKSNMLAYYFFRIVGYLPKAKNGEKECFGKMHFRSGSMLVVTIERVLLKLLAVGQEQYRRQPLLYEAHV